MWQALRKEKNSAVQSWSQSPLSPAQSVYNYVHGNVGFFANVIIGFLLSISKSQFCG